MHFAFIPYGKKEWVELLLKEMSAQKHKLFMEKGKIFKKYVWIQGQIRLLPFGVIEYVFPKEDLDLVLNTLIDDNNRYQIPNLYLNLARKVLRLKPVPEYNKDHKFLWIKQHVNIIPLGIREDTEIIGSKEDDKGYKHEAI